MGTTHAIPPVADIREHIRVTVTNDGEDCGQSILVDRQVLVGSSEHCDLQLSDPTVSRRHLILSPTGLGLRVRDQNSRNGIWLGKTRLTDGELPPGCEVRVGNTTLRLSQETKKSAPNDANSQVRAQFGRFIGQSPVLQNLYAQLDRAAASDVTVLLEGESGTGKELLAEAIHEQSGRAHKPFVVVDCGALSETLLESELFGHERGAFTGAERMRRGAFETAQGGTVFLDEIGELGLTLQTRLLRVLDRQQIRRLGSQQVIELDVRIVAATNRNLEREVEDSNFRLDLFHRLAVVSVIVPPLRERHGDIEILARHFLQRCGADESMLSDEVISRMSNQSWPGNVRELRNSIERLTLFGEQAMPVKIRSAPDTLTAAANSGLPFRQARAAVVEAFTAKYVESMLARHGQNVSAAARAAGVARRHFQRLKQRDGTKE